jgi:O-antigen/teichoic acid export membrane protein
MMELIRSQAAKLPTTWEGWVDLLRARLAHKATTQGVASLVDQVVASGTNFLTTIIIGRACLPEELGRYALGFTLVITLMSFPRSLIWTPYTTFMPRLDDAGRKLFSGSALVHQLIMCLVMGVAVTAAGGAMASFGGKGSGVGMVLVVLGPVMGLMLLREHIRRVSFSRLRVGDALALDVGVAVIQIGGMALLAQLGLLTSVRAYLVIAAATAPAVAVWLFASRRTMAFSRRAAIADFKQNWNFARWILTSAVVAGFTMAFYPWVLTLFHGTGAAGVYAAAMMVVSLTNPLVLGYSNFFAAHASHVYADEGARGLVPLVMRASLLMALICGLFAAVVIFWGEEILYVFYGAKYAGNGSVVAVMVLGDIAEVVTLPLTLGLMAIGRGDVFFKAHLIRLVLAATLGLWIIQQFGPLGAAYASLIAGLGASVWQWLAFRTLMPELMEARA